MTIMCAAQEGYAALVQDFLLDDPSCVNERDGCAPQCISCRISASRLPLPRLNLVTSTALGSLPFIALLQMLAWKLRDCSLAPGQT
jgi:hypothetical protein